MSLSEPALPDDTDLPTAPLANLRRRAEVTRQVRDFLAARGYWEVETPILSRDCCVDAHLDPLIWRDPAGKEPDRYLQTSPEFAMKRLLVAGSGSIFQITKVFRAGEVGSLHNPEFTMVEWYRLGGSTDALMLEISDLVVRVVGTAAADRISYRAAFARHAGLDPFFATDAELATRCQQHGLSDVPVGRDDRLNFLLAALVEPNLGWERPTFLHDFPPTQAALAVTHHIEGVETAARFELHYQGLELCNGFQELLDPAELRRRQREQNRRRVQAGKAPIPESSQLLRGMERGLPVSVGVALGLDRLVMLACKTRDIAEVIPFPWERA